ncbi:MAG: PIN domain-containing protein [Phycisphaeraceae bacterium]
MTYLVDTNIWLQVLRSRSRADEVRRFLESVPPPELAVTDYAVHSVGLILARFGQLDRYGDFLHDSMIGQQVAMLALSPPQLAQLAATCRSQRLDFDDAYHHLIAEIHDLQIVSFDSDFDRTTRGRRTPADVLQSLTDEK